MKGSVWRGLCRRRLPISSPAGGRRSPDRRIFGAPLGPIIEGAVALGRSDSGETSKKNVRRIAVGASPDPCGTVFPHSCRNAQIHSNNHPIPLVFPMTSAYDSSVTIRPIAYGRCHRAFPLRKAPGAKVPGVFFCTPRAIPPVPAKYRRCFSQSQARSPHSAFSDPLLFGPCLPSPDSRARIIRHHQSPRSGQGGGAPPRQAGTKSALAANYSPLGRRQER